MQTLREILTPTLILLLCVQGLLPIWVQMDFKKRQTYIANVLCENKNKPNSHCHGACYLKKRLLKTGDESSQNPLNKTERRSLEISPYFLPNVLVVPQKPLGFKLVSFFLSERPLEGFPLEIAHPPNFVA